MSEFRVRLRPKLTVVERNWSVNEGVVEQLEGMLEHARSGRIVGMAIVTVNQDGSLSSSFDTNRCQGGPGVMVGAVELLKWRISRGLFES